MTTESTSEAAIESETTSPMNPYTMTLLWLWVGAFTIAGILTLMGVSAADNSSEPAAGAVQFAWASIFTSLGIGGLLVWLLVNGLRWKAPEN